MLNFKDRKGFYLPYNNVKVRQKIIIYNSGSFGQHLYSSLEDLKQFQIIAWVDEAYDEAYCYPVQ